MIPPRLRVEDRLPEPAILGNLVTGKPPFGNNNNWAPRFGFAWTPGGSKRTVVRGQTQFVYKLQDIDGAFFAKGQSIKIELRAPDEQTLSMSAFGRGQVTRLSGEGTYHLNGDDEHEWTSAVLPIEIAPPQSFPKPTPPGGGDRSR